jgi:hypothetical protein
MPPTTVLQCCSVFNSISGSGSGGGVNSSSSSSSSSNMNMVLFCYEVKCCIPPVLVDWWCTTTQTGATTAVLLF